MSLAVAGGLTSVSWGLTLVAPNAWTSTEGPTNNTFPFGLTTTARYQQVYNKAEFSAAGAQLRITAMRFRLDVPTGVPFTDTETWNIRLSTTAAAADGLSATFASNLGTNTVSVFNGTQAFNAAGAGGTPKNFEATILFTTPYIYTVAQGNLLWDVTRTSTNPSHSMDAVFVTGDSVSRVWAGNATDTVGSPDSLGVITQFEYTVVPEPASLTMLGLGALALLRRRRR